MFTWSDKEHEKSQQYNCDAGRKVKPLAYALFSAKTKLAFLIVL